MTLNQNHFKVSKLKDNLFVIKETISLVHPVYTNDFKGYKPQPVSSKSAE